MANYDDLARAVAKWVVQGGQSHRIVSLDLETKVLSPSDFLTGETILSFALARRVNGSIETRLFTLDNETPDSQQALFDAASQEIERIRPLIALGYNITGYDFPLLRIKLRNSPIPHWALIDMVERAFILDMKYPLKFELARSDGSSPRVRTLEDVVNHPRFSQLELSRTKNMLNGLDKSQKGQKIYDMWKMNKNDFGKYATGDVVDVLLLFEEMFRSEEAAVEVKTQ
jgi:hypothetical protein